ncbi:response regulator transcription factor [Rubinisphaera margarita]|uniref:response regulator transcription factor n=1 Tax=Rubinisphaera margarita TaxID=2909586 RepID=UPI001EE79524|nr:response regulator transcription factor [Rubinisphaera margarita]MCG6154706.1 response regulator transcription factor [Rubinisphaera margarita]
MIDSRKIRETGGESLLIADPNPFVCEAIRALVKEWGLFEQIDVAHGLPRVLQIAREASETVLLLVDRWGSTASSDIVEQIKAFGAPHRIVVLLTDVDDPSSVSSLLSKHPAGVITRADSPHVIYRCLHSVCLGATYRSELVTNAVQNIEQLQESRAGEDGLTNRQREVLCLLAEGFSVKEIASMMHLSAKSVDSHKYRIMKKLKLNDRVRLARYAIREGLIEA